jgi:hypothetical protein
MAREDHSGTARKEDRAEYVKARCSGASRSRAAAMHRAGVASGMALGLHRRPARRYGGRAAAKPRANSGITLTPDSADYQRLKGRLRGAGGAVSTIQPERRL